ncbi:tonB-dependent receptor family protein [Asticcacaulis biprosthecium C19]|uniref:TonB-dependent receptor family protein n=1 Tax=Asticcacaulis biprosthecium C19 TaxID=715226 RepID=F4QSR8_9CAUL|nr:TonB-dependent receptor [Asticcacaulis biprosthecium]EGF89788.1 tonB-dependent receptor family protein [Asticcacaulis biprosthecium C19]
MKNMLMTGAAAGALLLIAAPSFAQTDTTTSSQTASSAAETAPVEVVITGFRKSLSDARRLKRSSNIQIDAIVAEDMAKFPELNLAESLQRLPGVQITREAGEGRRISLRGLGPDFARVQLNGMEVLGNVDSAQDSRGQRSRDRAFDFNIFASELFSRVEVEKTFEAAQKEGGMGGTVGLYTGKPFDYKPGSKGALSVKIGTNEYTQDVQPRIAALYSYNWDNRFGIAVSAAYSTRETTEQGHNTYNYEQPSAGKMAELVAKGLNISKLTTAQQAKFLSGDLYFADGNRISSWNSDQERLGLTAAVQWRPVENMLLTLDVLHGEYTTERSEVHLATRPLASSGSVAFDTAASTVWPTAFQTASVINNLTWDSSNYVTMTDVTGTTFGSEHRRSLNENRFDQIALTGKWNLSDRLTLEGHIGYEKSTYETPYDDKLYMRARGNLIADYGSDGRSASFQYPNWDTTDPDNYVMDSFYYRGFNNQSELREAEFNASYALSDVWTLRAGAAYHRFSQGGIDKFYDDNVNGTRTKTRGTSVADITSVYTNEFGSWLIGDYGKAFAKYNEYHRFGPNRDGTGGALQDIENVYDTTESTISEFVQADWDSELFGKRFRGNIGLRGYQTDTRSVGWIQGDSYAYLGTADVEGSYSGVLPALNTVLEMTPDVLVRFSATQNLNRPGLGSMAAKGSAFQSNEDCDFSKPDAVNNCEISASRGNPDLKPYKDDTLDLSVEYYFGKTGLVSAGVFQKKITNFIDSQNLENIPFSETGVPSGTIPGANENTIVDEFSMPVNISGTKTLTGFELVAQGQLSFLPAPFDNLGVVANYTSVDAPIEITGISKTSYNATVYYETEVWGARASLSHRSKWYSGRSSSVMSASTRGFQESTYVDAAAFYNINAKLQLSLNAINLTNQKDTQFWGQNEYLYNQNQSGTTYMFGLAYKF